MPSIVKLDLKSLVDWVRELRRTRVGRQLVVVVALLGVLVFLVWFYKTEFPPWVSFLVTVLVLLLGIGALSLAHRPIQSPPPATADQFPGMGPYDASAADHFLNLGRTSELQLLGTWLKSEAPAAFVIGPSGAGKTSLLQAGIVPRIQAEGYTWTFLALGPDSTPNEVLTSVRQDINAPSRDLVAPHFVVLDDLQVIGQSEAAELLKNLACASPTLQRRSVRCVVSLNPPTPEYERAVLPLFPDASVVRVGPVSATWAAQSLRGNEQAFALGIEPLHLAALEELLSNAEAPLLAWHVTFLLSLFRLTPEEARPALVAYLQPRRLRREGLEDLLVEALFETVPEQLRRPAREILHCLMKPDVEGATPEAELVAHCIGRGLSDEIIRQGLAFLGSRWARLVRVSSDGAKAPRYSFDCEFLRRPLRAYLLPARTGQERARDELLERALRFSRGARGLGVWPLRSWGLLLGVTQRLSSESAVQQYRRHYLRRAVAWGVLVAVVAMSALAWRSNLASRYRAARALRSDARLVAGIATVSNLRALISAGQGEEATRILRELFPSPVCVSSAAESILWLSPRLAFSEEDRRSLQDGLEELARRLLLSEPAEWEVQAGDDCLGRYSADSWLDYGREPRARAIQSVAEALVLLSSEADVRRSTQRAQQLAARSDDPRVAEGVRLIAVQRESASLPLLPTARECEALLNALESERRTPIATTLIAKQCVASHRTRVAALIAASVMRALAAKSRPCEASAADEVNWEYAVWQAYYGAALYESTPPSGRRLMALLEHSRLGQDYMAAGDAVVLLREAAGVVDDEQLLRLVQELLSAESVTCAPATALFREWLVEVLAERLPERSGERLRALLLTHESVRELPDSLSGVYAFRRLGYLAETQGKKTEAREYYESALAGLVVLSEQEAPDLRAVLSPSVARQFEDAMAEMRAAKERERRAQERAVVSWSPASNESDGESIDILGDAPPIMASGAAAALSVLGEAEPILNFLRSEEPPGRERRRVFGGDRDGEPLGEVRYDTEQLEYCAAGAGLAASLIPLQEEAHREKLLSVAGMYCTGSDAAMFPLLELLAAARTQGPLPEVWRIRLRELLEATIQKAQSDFYFGRPYTGLAMRVAAAGDLGWAERMLEHVERRQPFYPSEFAREIVLADLARAYARLGNMHEALRIAMRIGGSENRLVALADILRIDRARRVAAEGGEG